MTHCLCKTPCWFERAKCENLDTKFHDPWSPFSVRTVRTILTDRRIFSSFTNSQTDSLTDWKIYSRSVNLCHEPYGSYDPWSHFQFVRSVRSVRIDEFFQASVIVTSCLFHRLKTIFFLTDWKLYSRSVNPFHEPYGSYDPWSHFQFVRSVRSVKPVFH